MEAEVISRLIGVPYLDKGRDAEIGLDCWGVVRAALSADGIEIPSYVGAYASAEEVREVAALIERESATWVRVPRHEAALGDVVRLWIRHREAPSHVGVYLGGGKMLHTRRSCGACVEDLTLPLWAPRVVDFWRHVSRAGTWQLVACPSPISSESITLAVPRGTTILEALVAAKVKRHRDGGFIRVLVGDEDVPRSWWGRIKPKPGQLVTARSVPGDPVSLFFAIGGAIGSSLIGTGAGLAAGLSIAGGILGTAAVIGGLSYASYALSSLGAAPERKQSGPRGPAQSPQAHGVGNRLERWAKVRSGYGTLRVFPDLAAPAYTKIIGREKFWQILLNVGRGRYQVDHRTLVDGVLTGQTGIEVGGVPIEDIIGTTPGAAVEIFEGGTPKSYPDTILDTEPEDDSPVSYWRLDDAVASSSAANEISGGPALAQTGGVTFGGESILRSVGDGSALFDGTDDRLETTSPTAVDLNAGWAFEAWTQAASLPGATARTIAHYGTTANGVGFGVNDQGVEVNIPGTGAVQIYLVSAGLATRHLVFNAHAGIVDIWVDGQWHNAIGTDYGQSSQMTPVTFLAPSARLTVGARYNGTSHERFWHGRLQEVAFYPVTLTESEIALHYRTAHDGVATQIPRILEDSPQEVPINSVMRAPDVSSGEWWIGSYTTREIPGDVDRLEFEVFFPQGIFRINEKGDSRGFSVGIQIEYRKDGGNWVSAAPLVQPRSVGNFGAYMPSQQWGVGTNRGVSTPDGGPALLAHGETQDALLQGFGWNVPLGHYEMRHRPFATQESGNRGGGGSAVFADYELLLFKGIRRKSAPVRAKGLCLIGVSLPVLETGSTVGQISVLRKRMLRTYAPGDPDADAHGFTPERVTDNAAWSYLDALIGEDSLNPRPIATLAEAAAKVNLAAIADFATRAKPFHGDIDFATNIWDAAQMILTPSQASIAMAGGKWTVVEDRAGLTPKQLITPRNASGWRGVKRFVDVPHCMRVAFLDEENGYQESEARAFADGYDELTATRYDTIDGRGITNRTLAVEFGKKWIRKLEGRPESWTVEMFLEHLVSSRGDLVRAQVPMALVGQRSLKVKTVATSGANVTSVTLEGVVSYTFGTLYGCRYRLPDGDHFTLYSADVTNPSPSGTVESATVTFVTPIPIATAPAVGRLLSFGERGLETMECLISGIRRKPSKTRDGILADVELMPYAPEIHNAVDDPAVFVPVITRPAALPTLKAPLPPRILRVDSDARYVAFTPSGPQSRLRVVCQPRAGGRGEPFAIRVRVQKQVNPSDPESFGQDRQIVSGWVETFPAELFIGPVIDGQVYQVQAQAQTREGVTSPWSGPMAHRVVGLSEPPDAVQDIRIEGNEIVWTYPQTVLDLDGFRVRYLHGQQPAGLWDAAFSAHGDSVWRGTRFPFTNVPHDSQPVTLLVKAVDFAGNESTIAARVVVPASFATRNAVETLDQRALGWPGTKTDCTVVSGDLAADETAGDDTQDAWLSDDTQPAWDADDTVLAWETPHSELATYVAAWTPALEDTDDEVRVDLAWTPAHAIVSAHYRELGPGPAWEDDDATPAWSDDDGDLAWGDDEWSEWRLWPGRIGQTEHKPYEFRATLAEMIRNRPKLTQLDLITDADDVRETLRNVPISAAGSRLPLARAYRAIKFVSVVSQTGKTIAVRDYQAFGPLVEASEAGVLVADTVDGEVLGY